MKKFFLRLFFSGFVLAGLMAIPALASAATLSLSPASRSVAAGSSFTVNISLDTAGQSIYGVDINALHYDPTLLSVTDADSVAAGTQIAAGSLMPITAYNNVNTATGVIQFSQISSTSGTNFNGVGNLASITFTALKSGTATLTFDFTLGSTTDTNVASLYTDLLTGVTNGNYTITNSVDLTAPSVPAGLTASATASSIIKVSWSASTDPIVGGQTSSGVAGYKIFRNGTQVATSSALTINDSGLNAGTSYNYTVAAYDNAGNISAQSGIVTATTLANVDTTAPSVPINPTATAISTSAITLSWTASTDPTVAGQSSSGLAGYKIFRGGSQIGTSGSTSFNDTGLTAATNFSYTIAAYDNAGNISAQTSPVSATTLSNPDITAPTVSINSPSSGAGVTGTITVSASASDPIVTGQVTSGISVLTVSLDGSVYASSNTGTISKSLDTSTLVNGSHTFTAVAKDSAGNQASAPPITVTVFNLSTATRFPRKLVLSSLEGLSTIPAGVSLTANVLSGASVLESQNNLLANSNGEYTITFLPTDPQVIDIRITVAGYLSAKLSSLDTTINSASDITVPQLSAGDFNNDNTINTLDYSLLNSHYNQNFAAADINRDGLVNSLDYAILKNNWNKTGQ